MLFLQSLETTIYCFCKFITSEHLIGIQSYNIDVTFYVASFTDTLSSKFYVIACISISFPVIARWCCTVWLYHVVFIHSVEFLHQMRGVPSSYPYSLGATCCDALAHCVGLYFLEPWAKENLLPSGYCCQDKLKLKDNWLIFNIIYYE